MNLQTVTHQMDMRGEVSPYAFVRVRLAMEELPPQQVLQVLVDYPPAVTQVPRSMRNGGHDVLDVQSQDAYWVITLRKSML